MHSETANLRLDGTDRRPPSTGVAMLPWEEVRFPRDLFRISERERSYFERLKRRSRRVSWMAGRLTAKFLFLETLERNGASEKACRGSLPRRAEMLHARKLDAFSTWHYRSVEILPRNSQPGSIPEISWCGRKVALPLSLAHAHSLSAAILGSGSAAGIDLESPARRAEAFQRRNFTKREREWVGRHASGEYAVDWMYTFLWTAKEATLKAGLPGNLSLWSFPQLEIELSARSTEILSRARFGNRLDEDFKTVTLEVKHPLQKTTLHAGVAATRNRILTVILT